MEFILVLLVIFIIVCTLQPSNLAITVAITVVIRLKIFTGLFNAKVK